MLRKLSRAPVQCHANARRIGMCTYVSSIGLCILVLLQPFVRIQQIQTKERSSVNAPCEVDFLALKMRLFYFISAL